MDVVEKGYLRVIADILSRLTPAHFCPQNERALRLRLMKLTLRLVGIETSSYCNRRCAHCPNLFLDRHSFDDHLDESVFLKLIRELREIDFNGMIALQHYNEPTANREELIRRIFQARLCLPKATLHCSSNGDYLDHDYLSELAYAGLNKLLISLYVPVEVIKDEKAVRGCLKKAMARFGMPLQEDFPGATHSFQIKDMEVTVRVKDFSTDPVSWDRGGLLKNIGSNVERTSPCTRPFSHLTIEYNGNVMLCCNTRSDAPEHQEFILGNVSQNELNEIYFSSKSLHYKSVLSTFSSQLISPCNSCNLGLVTASEENKEYLTNRTLTNFVQIQKLKKQLNLYKKNETAKSQ